MKTVYLAGLLLILMDETGVNVLIAAGDERSPQSLSSGCQYACVACMQPASQLIEWNGYETCQTPLLYVFVDLKVHNVQKNSYHFDCIDQ